jgi:hypothetical protein
MRLVFVLGLSGRSRGRISHEIGQRGPPGCEMDDRVVTITGRRAVLETAFAQVGEETPGVTIRRGVSAGELLLGAHVRPGCRTSAECAPPAAPRSRRTWLSTPWGGARSSASGWRARAGVLASRCPPRSCSAPDCETS